LHPQSESLLALARYNKVAKISAALQFTAEETILLRGLAKGNSVKQIARLLRFAARVVVPGARRSSEKTGMLKRWCARGVGAAKRGMFRSTERRAIAGPHRKLGLRVRRDMLTT